MACSTDTFAWLKICCHMHMRMEKRAHVGTETAHTAHLDLRFSMIFTVTGLYVQDFHVTNVKKSVHDLTSIIK